MIYPENFEQKIGFDQIRQLLKRNCSSSLGHEKVDELVFLTNFDALIEQLDRGDEFRRIILQEQAFPESFFLDVRPALNRLRIEGTWMDEAEMFDLRRSLDSIFRIVRFFAPDSEGYSPYPRLSALAGSTAVYPDVLKKIDSILSKFGKVLDNASPELSRIRRELTQTMNGLSRRLNQIMKQAQSEGIVEKDASPSMRDGRLVIPVSPMYKRKIRGIVHDESATGKTVFIEPEELVEANNKIRELENEERREIIRILVAFSDFVRPFAPEMALSYHFLGEIDFVRSKARLALDIHAIRPRMEDAPSLDWVKAVHPLLMLSFRKQQKEVVPLTLTLNAFNRILIISGPNAGGKSVCLKTVGLLQYMVQCGLMIPLHDSSHVGWFERLFIDIGDEQSIENDLSTYSSHLLNMKYFLRHAQGLTLLLIDEFGSGTEPKIGGAMAESCLDRFNAQGAYGVITTHYSNLKHYADEHDGLINGAMLYDRHEMRPLFVLETGRPGSSFAIEIARKIGLPEEVIAAASAKVGSDYIDMDKFLQDIVRDKRYWENKRQSIRQQEKKLASLTEQYEADILVLNKERKDIISKAKTDATQILNESNALIENTIRGIKEAQAEKFRTQELRKELQGFKNSVAVDAVGTLVGSLGSAGSLRSAGSVVTADSEDDTLIQRKLANKIEKIRRRDEEKAQLASGTTGFQDHTNEDNSSAANISASDANILASDANISASDAKNTVSVGKNIASVGKNIASVEKNTVSVAKNTVSAAKNTVSVAKNTVSAAKNTVSANNRRPSQKPLVIKDTVRIKGQTIVGSILEIKGLKAVIGFGSLKSTVLLENLEPAKPQKEKGNPYTTLGRRTSDELREKKLQFRQEIDVRGQRADEALQTVMYYVDDAIMTGVSRIRILHGTGTGVLRQLIRQYLSTVPGVAKFADEHIQFGGSGITVVDLE